MPSVEFLSATPGAQPIRVLLVDDSAYFAQWAMRFLLLEPQIELVGWAVSGRDALDQVVRLQPHVVLMDVHLPDITGLRVTEYIKTQPHAPVVIIVTLDDNAQYRAAATLIHADGFLAKADIGTQLVPLIDQLCKRL